MLRAAVRSVLIVAVLCAGCGPTVDLTKALQIDVLDSGWFDAGIVNGQNKLVPAIKIAVKNNSDQKLVVLQINSGFRHGGEAVRPCHCQERVPPFFRVAPGATAGPLLLKSQNGYTGTDQSRQEMLKNTQFVDAKVQLSAKYASLQWVKMGEYPIERKLLEK